MSKYVMCAGGLVAQGDHVKLKNGRFLFRQRYIDFFVTDIEHSRVRGKLDSGELIWIPRGDFIDLIKANDVAVARIKNELGEK